MSMSTQRASGADELEEEMLRARESRLNRRSQLGRPAGYTQAVASKQESPSSSPLTSHSAESKEDTLRRLLASREGSGPASHLAEANSTPSTEMPSAKRGAALLERYGGAMGPTGVARPGTSDSPVSLASFMGGKASGPRLGKLVGDGKSAPPEASLIDSKRFALHGLTSNALSGDRSGPGSEEASGRSLASFLNERAAEKGNLPEKSQATQTSPAKASTEYTPSRAFTGGPSSGSGSMKDAATSPLKADQLPNTRRISPTATPKEESLAVKDEFETAKDAAYFKPSLSKPPIEAAETPDSLQRVSPPSSRPQSGLSPAFLATQRSEEKLPTASLTRLRSKRMVEQRVREAQERSSASSTDGGVSSTLHSSAAARGDTDFGPAKPISIEASPVDVEIDSPRPPSPFKRRDIDRLSRSPPKHTRGNALPGLAHSESPREAPRRLYAFNRKTSEDEVAQYSGPFRLPGMGGASSPFKNSPGSIASQEKEEESTVLSPLTKGRAKPQRANRVASGTRQSAVEEKVNPPEPVSEHISREAFTSARGVFGNELQNKDELQARTLPEKASQESPAKVEDVTRPRQSSAERLAESAAALEALVQGRKVKTPEREMSMPAPMEKRPAVLPSGTIRLSALAPLSLDTSVMSAPSSAHSSPLASTVDVSMVLRDGSLKSLKNEEASILYETETHIVTLSASGKTEIHAHVGRLSSVVTGNGTTESKAVMEAAQRSKSAPIDARQGRESLLLVRALGGRLITREGKRESFDPRATCMYQVRGVSDAIFIDQVDLLTSSLSSALSVVVCLEGEFFVWNGRGSIAVIRDAALKYATELSNETSKQPTVYEEGCEDEFFWTCFDRETEYASAWHHSRISQLRQEDCIMRLWTVVSTSAGLQLREDDTFCSIDVRRDGIHILQLPLELYVLVGPDARSKRLEIKAALDAASVRARTLFRARGPHSMPLPVHIVVFPSLVPRELRTALRYWNDDHLNGKRWQRMHQRMNVWERREALQQLERTEIPARELDDELFLPVGVGLEDLKSLQD